MSVIPLPDNPNYKEAALSPWMREGPVCPDEPQKRLTSLAHPENSPKPR